MSSGLAVVATLLLLFGFWPFYRHLQLPDIAAPFHFVVLLHFAALIWAGFGAQVVQGNVSGNPAVKPARKMYGAWLLFHSIWLILFAGFRMMVLSLGFGVVEWGISVFTIQKFYNVDPKGGVKVLLFFLMTTYLMYVNAALISLNEF